MDDTYEYDKPDKVLTRKDWNDAYNAVQYASNLCGVAQSFAKLCLKIMDEARAQQHGTDWVNNHPLITLYLSKMDSLNSHRNALDAFEMARLKLEGWIDA